MSSIPTHDPLVYGDRPPAYHGSNLIVSIRGLVPQIAPEFTHRHLSLRNVPALFFGPYPATGEVWGRNLYRFPWPDVYTVDPELANRTIDYHSADVQLWGERDVPLYNVVGPDLWMWYYTPLSVPTDNIDMWDGTAWVPLQAAQKNPPMHPRHPDRTLAGRFATKRSRASAKGWKTRRKRKRVRWWLERWSHLLEPVETFFVPVEGRDVPVVVHDWPNLDLPGSKLTEEYAPKRLHAIYGLIQRTVKVVEKYFPQAVDGLHIDVAFNSHVPDVWRGEWAPSALFKGMVWRGLYDVEVDVLWLLAGNIEAGQRLSRVLAHEIGHRFYYRNLSDKGRQAWERHIDAPYFLARTRREYLTNYALLSPVEAFAEAFSFYIVEGPNYLGPETRAFFEEISRTGGAVFDNPEEEDGIILLRKRND